MDTDRPNDAVLEPVDRESTPSIIARKLRKAISSGKFAQGRQLIEADLARELRTSRGPLREAMQRLTQEGLLISVRNRGLFVTTLTDDDVRDVYFARMAIERAAAHRVMATGPAPQALAAMRARLDELEAADGDPAAAASADFRFHEQLVELAGSPRLSRMHATLMTETQMCLSALADSYQRAPGDRLTEHKALLAAITAGDKTTLEELLAAHADDALRRLGHGSG